MKYVITCTEVYSVTYEIEAGSKEDAIRKWENMKMFQATDYVLDDTLDRRINEESF